MAAYDVFGQVWVRLPSGDWRRHLVRECTCCNRLSVQELNFVLDDSVFCLACFSTNMRLVDVRGQRMFRCSDCQAVTEFDAFLGVDEEGDEFFGPRGNDLFVDEILEEESGDDEDDEEDWKR